MPDLPAGTVTFLFTDIEGSTRLLKSLGESYRTVLTDHQRLLREAFSDAAGREIDTQGDAFFFVFQRGKDAVAGGCAWTSCVAVVVPLDTSDTLAILRSPAAHDPS